MKQKGHQGIHFIDPDPAAVFVPVAYLVDKQEIVKNLLAQLPVATLYDSSLTIWQTMDLGRTYQHKCSRLSSLSSPTDLNFRMKLHLAV